MQTANLRDKIIAIQSQLYTSSEDCDFHEFIQNVLQIQQQDSIFEDFIQYFLELHSIIRPNQIDFHQNIEKQIYLNNQIFDYSSVLLENAHIKNLHAQNSKINSSVETNNIQMLTNIVMNCPHLHEKIFCSELLDIAALYGSVHCFMFLLINKVPLSDNICSLAIAGGNLEIITRLENCKKNCDFCDKKCFKTSITYHQYGITEWLMTNYGHIPDVYDIETAVLSLNFKYFEKWKQFVPIEMKKMLAFASAHDIYIFYQWQYLDDVIDNIIEIITETKNPEQKTQLMRAYIYYKLKDIENVKELFNQMNKLCLIMKII